MFNHRENTTTTNLCAMVNLPRSVYHYKSSDNPAGRKPSTETFKQDGSKVSNDFIVEEIKVILSGEFVNYGYDKTTEMLRRMQYIINEKKVYRLMEENNLLLGKIIRTKGKRKWVEHRKIKATRPMEYLCLDIKYVWVEGEKRNYYLLTILDVFTRKVLRWIFQSSIRKDDVIVFFSMLNKEHGLKGVCIRNDNGSQFIAGKVREYLKHIEAVQEFTHIATPEENSYIEAYHSNLDRDVIRRMEFSSFYEAKEKIRRYVLHYNSERPHRGIKMKSPDHVWNEYYKSFSSDKPLKAQVVTTCQGAPMAPKATCEALDKLELQAIFAYQMNDDCVNNQISNQIFVQEYGG
jgi:putative transposase